MAAAHTEGVEFEAADALLNDYDGAQAYAALVEVRRRRRRVPLAVRSHRRARALANLQKFGATTANVAALERLAHACYIRANCEEAKAKRVELLREGRAYALKALDAGKSNAAALKVGDDLGGRARCTRCARALVCV